VSQCEEQGPVDKPPLLDRIVAVAYVLSVVLRPVGFFLLAGIAVFFWVRRGLDGTVLGLGVAAVGWFVGWGAFRWWAPRWGRRRWPNEANAGKTDSDAPR